MFNFLIGFILILLFVFILNQKFFINFLLLNYLNLYDKFLLYFLFIFHVLITILLRFIKFIYLFLYLNFFIFLYLYLLIMKLSSNINLFVFNNLSTIPLNQLYVH